MYIYPTSVSWLLTSPFFYCNCSPLRHHVPFYITVYAQNKLCKMCMQVWDGKTSAVLGPDRKFLQKGGSTWFLPVTYFCVQNQLGLLAWGSTWFRLCHVTYFCVQNQLGLPAWGSTWCRLCHVTYFLCAESAGSASVGFHLVSPLSRDLFCVHNQLGLLAWGSKTFQI